MLFSQPKVSDFMNEHFECAWESVHTVPLVTIDFGDGRRLERTLRGNIATWVCDAEGLAYDLLPGLVGADEYVPRLTAALEIIEGVRPLVLSSGPTFRLYAHHAYMAQVLRSAERRSLNIAKFFVEGAVERELAVLEAVPAAAMPLEPGIITAKQYGVILDTKFARERGWAQAHDFLAEALSSEWRMRHVHELTVDAYRDLLHVDLGDPYLGLAPDVLGGEVGRH